MGDRANIKLNTMDGGTIYLYTHWGGTELPKTLQSALIRGRERWTDEAYLARIIFSEMVKDDILGLTGVGLSTQQQDNEPSRPIILVAIQEQAVTIGGKAWTFEEYVADSNLP